MPPFRREKSRIPVQAEGLLRVVRPDTERLDQLRYTVRRRSGIQVQRAPRSLTRFLRAAPIGQRDGHALFAAGLNGHRNPQHHTGIRRARAFRRHIVQQAAVPLASQRPFARIAHAAQRAVAGHIGIAFSAVR